MKRISENIDYNKRFLSRKFILSIVLGVYVSHNAYAVDCPSKTTLDSLSGHCIITGSDCSGNCHYRYDFQTQELIISPNEDSTGDLMVENAYLGIIPYRMEKVTIEEGITSLGKQSFNTDSGRYGDVSGAYLKLPQSLKIIDGNSVDTLFGTVELSMENLKSTSNLGLRSLSTLILTPAEGKSLPWNFIDRRRTNGRDWGVRVECKGALSLCNENVAAVKQYIENMGLSFSTDYYTEYDGNRIVRRYTETGYNTYKTLADGSYTIYDENNNIIGYKGKRIFTVEEANKVSKPTGNRVSLRYK